MKHLLFILMMLMLLAYIIVYKLYLVFYGELIKYIINPLIFLLFAFITYFVFYYKNKKIFKYKMDIFYIVIGSALVYLIIFYTAGLFTIYTKNPYSSTLSGIVINLFSILFVIGLKEYIRNGLIIGIENYHRIYLVLIFLIFVLSDTNIVDLVKSFNDTTAAFTEIGQSVVPIVCVNLFMMFLCIKGGYLQAVIYRTLIFLPTLVVPIIPKYEWIVPTLFDILFPLFSYLIIQYMINKREKMIASEITEQFNPRNWIITFVLTILIIMFGLGTFRIKPAVIITASMQPNINPGDLVIIEPIDIKSIKAGDIIQYKIEDYSVVHRVINIRKNREDILLTTKGDNNNNVDRRPVNENQLIGIMRYRIPLIGYPSYFIHKMIKGKEVEVETGK